MKLHILSDLHTEFADCVPPDTDADAVILAGDIGVGVEGMRWAARHYPVRPVIYVPGNHEFYGHDIDLTAELEAAAPENITLLSDDVLVLDGVRFLGSTLWTDFKLHGEGEAWFARERALASMNDFVRIRQGGHKFRPEDSVELHDASRTWLVSQLEQAFDGPTVVVTHHLPASTSIATMVRKPKPAPGRHRRLHPGEEKRLLDACDAHSNPMLGWIVRLAIHTGMRQGEIETLTDDQIDLKRRIAILAEPESGHARTKNATARAVPLSKPVADVIKQAIDNPIRPDDTPLIFFGEPGKDKRRRPYVFKPAWFKALRKAKIKGLKFHDLRHEAVSRLVEGGLTDQEVASISGHKSMQMLKRYTHLRTEDLVAKLDRIGI